MTDIEKVRKYPEDFDSVIMGEAKQRRERISGHSQTPYGVGIPELTLYELLEKYKYKYDR